MHPNMNNWLSNGELDFWSLRRMRIDMCRAEGTKFTGEAHQESLLRI